mmetsp:Transcript_20519/g.27729  ORF Transcript_20519/g.27729 Transcript_20519/m.27729 type:complete len:353 (+) Transcript_20519:1624-2682(+)
MDLHLVARASHVHQVVKNEHLFLARHSAGRYRARGLLNSEFLVVPIHSLHVIDGVWTVRVANDALGEAFPGLIRVCVVDGSLDVAALALEEDFGVLREHLSALGDDAFELDEGIEVHLAQFSQLVLHGQLADAHEYFLVKLLSVVGVDFLYDLARDCVEDREHLGRLLSKPNRKGGLLGGQVGKLDFEGLFVLTTHISDAVFVGVNTVVSKTSEEGAERFLNEDNDLLLLNPLRQRLLSLAVVVHILHISHSVHIFRILGATHHTSVHASRVVFLAGELLVVDQSGGHSGLAAVADHVDTVELLLSSAALVNGHELVVLIVQTGVLIPIKLGHGAVVVVNVLVEGLTVFGLL